MRKPSRRDGCLFVECNQSFGLELLQRALSHGLRVVVLGKKLDSLGHVTSLGVRVLECDTETPTSIYNAVRSTSKYINVRALIPGYEGSVHATSIVAKVLGLSGASPFAAFDTRLKHRARALTNSLVGNGPDFVVLYREEDVSNLPTTLFPLVAKPTANGGSFGVRVCSNVSELHEHLSCWIPKIGFPVLLERKLSGADYSAETFNGKLVAINEKSKGGHTGLVDVGHCLSGLEARQEGRLVRPFVERVVRSLDLNWGPAHIELMICGELTQLIEVNYRLGAGYIPDLVHLATGVDLYRSTLDLYLGLQVDVWPNHRQFAAIRFATSMKEGVLHYCRPHCTIAVEGVIGSKITLPSGSLVQPSTSSGDRFAHVIATGMTAREACLSAERGLSELKLAIH